MSRAPLALSVLLVGCLPNLSWWTVVAPDGGIDPRSDAGRPRDGAPPPRDGAPPPRDAGNVMPTGCEVSTRPLGAGYFEGFEAGHGGWGVTGERSSWELGTPATARITRAAEGTRAWMTGLSTPYLDNEESYVVSPCFDASTAAQDLLLTLSRAYHTEACCDRATVQYSVDGGVTWMNAAGTTRLNWYGSTTGFAGDSDWLEAATLLPGTAGQARVQVRVWFHADTSVNGEGFAFDAVSLRPSSVDLALSIAEAERCGFAIATITNVGGQSITGYELATLVDGASAIDPFDASLAYLETRRVEFGGPLARSLSADVFTVGDINPANDAAAFNVTAVVFPSGGTFSDFEADDGGLFVGGENASWARGVPMGALITGAASGTRAWVTNLSGEYNANERSYLQSVCYDMRALSRDPQISFMQVFRTEECCDRGTVEMSLDGASFMRVGTMTSGGTNWYNTSSGWSGSSGAGAWRTAQHPLTGARGHEFVRFRFYFYSDGSMHYDGFGLDDLQVIP